MHEQTIRRMSAGILFEGSLFQASTQALNGVVHVVSDASVLIVRPFFSTVSTFAHLDAFGLEHKSCIQASHMVVRPT
eukprot:scaffold2973_cov67-Cylindrotheca_fusiformis.AAC.5